MGETSGLFWVIGAFALILLLWWMLRRGSPPPAAPPAPRGTWEPPRPAPPRAAPQPPLWSKPQPAPAERLRGRAWVVDGDTLRLQNRPLRLFGIDAPEMDHPYGKSARYALAKLCKDQIVEAEITGFDEHGREVAKVTLPDGRDLSAEMVKAGLAIDWPKFSGGIYSALELPGVRKKLWLADARQKGRMQVWEKYAASQAHRREARAKGQGGTQE